MVIGLLQWRAKRNNCRTDSVKLVLDTTLQILPDNINRIQISTCWCSPREMNDIFQRQKFWKGWTCKKMGYSFGGVG